MTVVYVLVAIVVVLLILVGLLYNRMVRLRNEADTGWANIDVQLKRRNDLIPNLVEAVKGYAAHERGTFEAVTQARAAVAGAQGPAAAAEADNLLTAAIGRLFAVAEAYPDLKANENFLQLQNELAATEDKIAAARRYYNATVLRFNNAIQTFPAVLLAGPFGFVKREFFAAESSRSRASRRSASSRDPAAADQGEPLPHRSRSRCLRSSDRRDRRLGLRPLTTSASERSCSASAPRTAIYAYISSGGWSPGSPARDPVTREEWPEVYHLIDTVSIAAGMEAAPPLYVVDDPAPNAFAAGRTPATSYVVVTRGLLEAMSKRELEGVLAHEVSHIRNRDVRLMTLAAVLVGVVALISDLLARMLYFGGSGGRRKGGDSSGWIFLVLAIVTIILAPLAAVMIQMSLSRRREYLADASAAEITNDPEGLALALRRLELDQREIQHVNQATAHLYIETPLRNTIGAGEVRVRPVQHPPAARGADRGARGGRRLPAPRDAPDQERSGDGRRVGGAGAQSGRCGIVRPGSRPRSTARVIAVEPNRSLDRVERRYPADPRSSRSAAT